MRHKRSKKKHPLNDPARWDEDISPPFFDRQAFQQRIDDRVGLNKDGKSIVRLIWGPESIGLFGVPRYWLKRYKDGETWKYVTIKRWYLESRLERDAYFDSWNAARYSLAEPSEGEERCGDCGSSQEPIDVFGQRRCARCGSLAMIKGKPVDRGAPPDEFFIFQWMCAEHEDIDQDAGWPKCCERLDKDRHRRCFGEFRNPNDEDLERVSAAIRARDAEPWRDPYAPLSAQELALIESASGVQMEKTTRAVEERQREVLRNQHVLSERGGTFHDMGGSFKKTDSGLLIPN